MVMGVMPKKAAHRLTTDQLAKRVFGKSVHKRLKALALELDEKPKRKPPTRKPKP
jgi:hypothetical protein